MPLDPDHPIVTLCIEGMRAEADGRFADASALFQRAWAEQDDALGACIAAHYVARHQDTPENTLYWNEQALAHAGLADDAAVREFFPSLYLNLGHSYEVLGHHDKARMFYDLAADRVADITDGRYGRIVRAGIARHRGPP